MIQLLRAQLERESSAAKGNEGVLGGSSSADRTVLIMLRWVGGWPGLREKHGNAANALAL